MVEHFIVYLGAVPKTNSFNPPLDLQQTMLDCRDPYQHQLPQYALKDKTLIQTLKNTHGPALGLFNERHYIGA